MPKVLVLYDGSSDDAVRTARMIADGAESVRFTEVELRRMPLAEGGAAGSYDGIVLVLSRAGAAATAGALVGRLTDKVGAVVGGGGGEPSSTVAAMLGAGMILVGTGPDGDARALGARVAKVTEWVRHAKSHEHGHAHGHSHSH